MTTEAAQREPRLVHLVAGPRQTTGTIADTLAASGITVETLTDVYGAFAAACDHRRRGHDVIFVACVDDLLFGELEVFSYLTDVVGEGRAFVYGDARSVALIDAAAARGAAPIAALPDGLARVGTSRPAVAASRPRESSAEAAILRLTPSKLAPADPDGDRSHGSEVGGRRTGVKHIRPPGSDIPHPSQTGHRLEPGHDETPVRVPWLRYADTPRRISPSDRAASPPAPDSGQEPGPARQTGGPPRDETGSSSAPASNEPLLSREELDALLSDLATPGDPRSHEGRVS